MGNQGGINHAPTSRSISNVGVKILHSRPENPLMGNQGGINHAPTGRSISNVGVKILLHALRTL